MTLLRQVSVELHVGLAGWSSEDVVDVAEVAVVAEVFVVLTAKAMGNVVVVAVKVRNDRGRATTLRH